MIVYSASRAEFTRDVLSNHIERKILDAFALRLGRRTSKAEVASWKNSMQYMNNVLTSGNIPGDAGVAIEYQVPLTSKRVDFILSGADGQKCVFHAMPVTHSTGSRSVIPRDPGH